MLILAIVLVLVGATFQHYGISWDEEVQNTYGKKILSFYLSGFEDQSVFKYFNLYLYGGSFDLVAAIVNTVLAFRRIRNPSSAGRTGRHPWVGGALASRTSVWWSACWVF